MDINVQTERVANKEVFLDSREGDILVNCVCSCSGGIRKKWAWDDKRVL